MPYVLARRQSFLFFILIGGIVAADWFLKLLAHRFLAHAVSEKFLTIALVENRQGPFELLPLSVVIAVNIGTLVVLGNLMLRFRDGFSRAAVAMMLAGGVANVTERALYHRTTDFLIIGTSAWNVADVAILVGVVCFLARWYQRSRSYPS